MLAVKALLVDFDGTACLQDVSELLLDGFGEPGWERFDDAVDTGEMGLREAADHQVAMLSGSREEMLAFALEHAELAPTFAPFVAWAEEQSRHSCSRPTGSRSTSSRSWNAPASGTSRS